MNVADIDRTDVFEKTARGRAEVGERLASLGAAYRQLLIVIDGRKDIGTVASLFPRNDVAGMAATLWRAGLIELAPGNGCPIAAGSSPDAPVGSACGQQCVADGVARATPSFLAPVCADVQEAPLQQVQTIMATSARQCIGLLADQLIRRIEAASTMDELGVIAGQWHMAMRDSKQGRHLADELLDRVRGLLDLSRGA